MHQRNSHYRQPKKQCDVRIFVQTVVCFQEISMDYRNFITIEPGKRSGKPCIRGMRITVFDILSWLAGGMTIEQIIEDFPELTSDDILAALAFAADREHLSLYAA